MIHIWGGGENRQQTLLVRENMRDLTEKHFKVCSKNKRKP